jgi:hypothetical protein
MNTDLSNGISDDTMLTLVQRIRGFNYENATPDDNAVLIKALKTVAHDTIARWEHVYELERLADARLKTVNVTRELSEVCETLHRKPKKPAGVLKYLWR